MLFIHSNQANNLTEFNLSDQKILIIFYYCFIILIFSMIACISAIDTQQLPILREILLRFPLMLQICRALQQENFTNIVANVKYLRVAKNEGLLIENRSLYLFLGAGRIVRRGREERTEKSIRIKSRVKIGKGRVQVTPKQGMAWQVCEFGHFQETGGCMRNGENYYYPNSKHSLVLVCDFQNLSETLKNHIMQLRADKVKFLHSFPIFLGVQRATLEEQLHGFNFTQLKFGALRYPSSTSEVLFVKKGSVQIGSKGMQGRPIDGNCVVGLIDNDLQIKAISQSVHCYSIKLSLLQNLLAKALPKKQCPSPLSPLQIIISSAVSTPTKPDNLHLHLQKENKIIDGCQTLRASTSFKKRTNLKCISQLNNSLQKQRRLHLKKHFSNFYNQIFEEFSQKKAKQLALNSNSQEKLVLYQIKMLQRKQPRMEEINQRLRSLRLQKMKRCKQAVAENAHLKELRNVGVTIG